MSTTTPSGPWTGTNIYIQLLMLIGSIFGGMSADTATIIGGAIAAVVGAVFAARNWIVNAKFNLGKSWISDPNNWTLLSAVVVGISPKFAELIPFLHDVFDGLSMQNWGKVITAGFALLSFVFYTFFKKKQS